MVPTPPYEWEQVDLEYENNEVLANSKYLNRTISIRGKVESAHSRGWSALFSTGPWDSPNIVGVSGNIPTVSFRNLNILWCGFTSPDEVMNISVDDTIVVRGTVKYWNGTFLRLYPCSLVN